MTKYLLIEKQGKLSVEMVTSEEAEAMKGPCRTCGGSGKGKHWFADPSDLALANLPMISICRRCGERMPKDEFCNDMRCPDCITVHSERLNWSEAEMDKIELERRRNEQSIQEV